MSENKLKLIAEKAKQDKKLKFTSLIHHINAESLERCFKLLRKKAACGVDGVTTKAYADNLDANIKDLVGRMKDKKYKAQPVRRTYIPKAGKSELRPLGIPTIEDKLVQTVLKEILEAIYEQDFLNCSHGFRPGRSCHTAVKQINNTIMGKPINYIAEVDIRKFFDTVDHIWLIRCLEERIADKNLLWLIRKHLKAGVMEGLVRNDTEEGTPQGGVVSPLLANIYLHYVLDLWFELRVKPQAMGYIELVRYCDDFVVLCESDRDAQRFLAMLEERLSKFNLAISEEKTRIVKFGRQAWQQAKRMGKKPETFNFLGFTLYCGTSRKGKFSVRLKTSRQNLARKLKDYKIWIKRARGVIPLKDIVRVTKAKLTGHYNYFGVSGNFRCLRQYYRRIVRMVFKWINRRSQKKSMNLKQFWQYLEWDPLPTPRIKHALWDH